MKVPSQLLMTRWSGGVSPAKRGSLIFHKRYEKLRWLRVARMLRDDADATGRFVKRLARCQCHRFLASRFARVADLTALLQMPTILWYLESEPWYRLEADERQHICTSKEEQTP
jgi:hypothetical protein